MPLPFKPGPDPAVNLTEITKRIHQSARACNRDSGDISLIAVTKRQPLQKIHSLLHAGHRVFGENRLQEAQDKWPALREQAPGLELHMIGALQTNKVREALRLFDVLHTVDRPKLARKLAEEMASSGRSVKLFVQVNTGEEPQKSGIAPDDVDRFIAMCRADYQLPLVGLMCLPPMGEEPALHFALLREMAARNDLTQLSMGMSGDFEKAIAFGATHVRVGSSLMGERTQTPHDPSG